MWETDTQQTLAATSADGAGARHTGGSERGAGLERGDLVGRYVVLGSIGSGAMGAVYSAYDPELDRKVALKMLLPDSSGDGVHSSRRRERLVREAQALARLAHPNVVGIHDVGEHAGQVWLAMEYVHGVTLDAWIEADRRSVAERLEVLTAVARGVAAAHDADLLHRDLKPSNIMVGADGRVRVMDFGLARGVPRDETRALATPGTPDPARAEPIDPGGGSTLCTPLTRMDGLLGTPAYMAPEQWRHDDVAEAADQFSYCVTAWEALFGERPFPGATIPQQAAAVMEGRRRSPPRAAAQGVPGWLRRTLERGLATDPRRRWPSMQALLQSLQEGHTRAVRRRLLGGLALVALSVAGGWLGQGWAAQRAAAACDAAGAEIEALWPGRASPVEVGIRTSGVAHGATTAEKIVPWLDAWAAAWSTTRTKTCRAATLDETLEPGQHLRARGCLLLQRRQTETLIELFEQGNPDAVHRAVHAVSELARPQECSDRARLDAESWPGADQWAQVDALRERLAEVEGLHSARMYEEGRLRAEAILREAEALGWRPLQVEARLALGRLQERQAMVEEGERTLREAYFEAQEVGEDDLALEAASALISVVGTLRADHVAALEWGEHARTLVRRLEKEGTLIEASLLNTIGNVERGRAEYDRSLIFHGQALAIREQGLGPDHLAVAQSLNNLANVHHERGNYDDAEVLYRRALGVREAVLGPEHPDVATTLGNLSSVSYSAGLYDQAEKLAERTLAIRAKTLGADDPKVAETAITLAAIFERQGALEEALSLYERALGIRERTLGADHPEVASLLNNMAVVYFNQGMHEDAFRAFEQALAIKERTLGPEHPDVAASLANLARAHRSRGSYAQAQRMLERALAIQERTLVPSHPHVLRSLLALGDMALAREVPAEAIRWFERVLEAESDQWRLEAEHAQARFGLARALWIAGRDRPRARTLAHQAAAYYRTQGPDDAERVGEIERWLQDRR